MGKRYFNKIPQSLGKLIKEAWDKQYGDNMIGLPPRIVFATKFLQDKCLEEVAKQQINDYGFCSKLFQPGIYNKGTKKIKKSNQF